MGEHREGEALEVLYRISSLVGEVEDPREALQRILDEIAAFFGAASASVSLLHPETRDLRIEASAGLPAGSADFALELGVGVTGWVALHGEALVLPDTGRDPRYVALRPGVRSEIAVPMEERGQVIGVVNLDSDQPERFGPGDLPLLRLLTREATRAVSQLWTVQQLRTRASQLEVLVQLGQSIVSKRDPDQLLDSVAEAARLLLGARLAAVFLRGDRDGRLVLRALREEAGPRAYGEELGVEESSLGTAVRQKRQVEVLDLARTEEHHFVRLVQEEGLASMLATPVLFEGEPLGVLSVYLDHAHRFNNDEKKRMTALASLGAVALENARLYRRIFESEEQLNRNDKLTTLGLLSAEIAHEIRNPLTVIELLFSSIDFEWPEGDERYEDIRIIREKIAELEGIVSRVLDFGKPGAALRSRYRLATVVEESLHLVRIKLQQARVEVSFACPDPLRGAEVDANKGQIQQAILNLLINSLQAMPDGGRIGLELAAEGEGEEILCLAIEDTGTGIDPGLERRIFDSFLSGQSEGSGLGLSIVKRILAAHRGEITLARTGPGGSRFELRLPRAQ